MSSAFLMWTLPGIVLSSDDPTILGLPSSPNNSEPSPFRRQNEFLPIRDTVGDEEANVYLERHGHNHYQYRWDYAVSTCFPVAVMIVASAILPPGAAQKKREHMVSCEASPPRNIGNILLYCWGHYIVCCLSCPPNTVIVCYRYMDIVSTRLFHKMQMQRENAE